MAYRLKPDESVAAGAKRIVREQIDKALDEINDEKIDQQETVHQVRKRCKKVRAVIRLIRGSIDAETYKFENTFYRDAARELSHIRDTEAMIEAFDDLVEHYADQIDPGAYDSVRAELQRRQDGAVDADAALEKLLEAFRAKMVEGRDRVSTWSLDADGFPAVAGGIKKTYKRGLKALDAVHGDPSTEQYHEWRKRTKYHWYHTRILRDAWKNVMQARRDELSDLSDMLGDEHDLGLFRQMIEHDADAFGETTSVQAFVGLIDRRRAELRAEANTLGGRIYAEDPKDLVRRLKVYWRYAVADAEQKKELAEAKLPAGA